MEGERVQRRLAAILAADVAGYSRLKGADEEGRAPTTAISPPEMMPIAFSKPAG